MNQFFHGWRRKTGIVTLFLACVFMAGWVRSESVEDSLGGNIYSRHGAIECVTYQSTTTLFVVHVDENGNPFPSSESVELPQNLTLVPTQSTSAIAIIETIPWSVPYWTIVIPLTLLSAFLLLRKPPLMSMKSRVPVPTEGS